MDKRPPKRPHPFSIAAILSTIVPPPKRPRFFIENLIAPEQSGSGSSKLPKDYVTKLDSTAEQNTKFKVGHFKSRFSINDIPVDPEALLAGIFQQCIDEAIEEGHEKFGAKPDHFGCTINSSLLHSPVYTPIRPENENSMNALLNLFLKVAQSKKQDGINLWGAPFEVAVTTVNKSQLPTEQQIVGSAKRENDTVHHRIHDQCLIKINNTDGRCLFYALVATLMYSIGGMTRKIFFNYMHNNKGQRGKMEQDVTRLMKAVGAPMNLSEYKAKDYVPGVVNYWTVNGWLAGKSNPFRMGQEQDVEKLEEKCPNQTKRIEQLNRDFVMKICLQKDQNCNGSLILCYLGQMDPGLVNRTAQFRLGNKKSNKTIGRGIGHNCNEGKWPDWPNKTRHGIRVSSDGSKLMMRYSFAKGNSSIALNSYGCGLIHFGPRPVNDTRWKFMHPLTSKKPPQMPSNVLMRALRSGVPLRHLHPMDALIIDWLVGLKVDQPFVAVVQKTPQKCRMRISFHPKCASKRRCINSSNIH